MLNYYQKGVLEMIWVSMMNYYVSIYFLLVFYLSLEHSNSRKELSILDYHIVDCLNTVGLCLNYDFIFDSLKKSFYNK